MMPRFFTLRFFSGLFLFSLFLTTTIAQPKQLTQIPGFPSTEVYDLLTDSKGFLWIAHNGGISKYDGINFINYSSPLQTSPNVTGLIEDKYGRIWCHNFTGQIFYLQNGRMNLLEAYDSKDEPNFPRIGLFKDMLVATTKNGLFICDINTLKCHYEKCNDPLCRGTTSLSIQSNQIIALGNRCWYIFKPGNGLKIAHFNRADARLIEENVGTLNVETFRDTAFLFCNPGRVLYKLSSKHDSLQVCEMQQLDYFINTISVQKNGYLVNTVRRSIETPGNRVLNGYDITSLSIDKTGHRWYGTLGKGLMTNLESENPLKDRCAIPLLNNDLIECLLKYDNELLIGTQDGKLISYDPNTTVSKLLLELPAKSNGISYLKALDKNDILVGSPTKTFIYNIKLNRVEHTFLYMSVKQADTIGNAIILATSPGLIAQPLDSSVNYVAWKKSFMQHFKGFSDINGERFSFLGIEQRAKAVCCLQKTKTIWASLKNGLYSINNTGFLPFFYNGMPVYSSCLTTYGDKVVVGTFNNGILIIDGDDIKHLTTADGLLSNNILQIKISNENLWVYDNGLVQVFNIKTLKIADNYQLPDLSAGIVTDSEDIDGHPYLANAGGLFKISPTKFIDRYGTYLNAITVNGKDTGTINHLTLNYGQNDIQINVGVPSLLDGKDIVIKYRLGNNAAAKWTYGKAGERNFRFESLMPGNYHFEAMAGRPQTGIAGSPMEINFIITSPWWKRWWAISVMGLTGALVIMGIARLYYLNLLANEKAEFEKKLAVEKERQRISSDMHDDFGASLSAMKLYTSSIWQSGDDNNNYHEMYDMMDDLSHKVREIIWRLDNKSDTLESLIYFIERTSYTLFKHAGPAIKISLPDAIPEVAISSDKRQDIFLAVREALHNIIKHSGASNASLQFEISRAHLQITVTDNGRGIQSLSAGHQPGYGLRNIKERISNLGGQIRVEINNGTILKLKIPLDKEN